MKNKIINILIAVPTFESVETDTFKSIYGLERPENCNLMVDFIKGYDVARARNLIVHEALEYGFDYLLMVDSDIVLPRHALVKLLSRKKDIILGWYLRKRTSTMQTELFALGQKNFTDENNINAKDIIDKKEIFEVKGGGMGAAFISSKVFKKLGPHSWFKYIEYNRTTVLSEDNYFCSLATTSGFKIWADPEVRCGHISKFTT